MKILFILGLLFFVATESHATGVDVGITEHLGQKLSLDLEFVDEKGDAVPLKTFFNKGKPVVMALVYYGCPNLCNFLLKGFVESLKKLEWTAGEKFEFMVVSIDPNETFDLAAKKREAYLKEYGRKEAGEGWHFLTGTSENIKKIADEIGFNYQYDEGQKQYAHAAGIYFVTSDGVLSRYLYGLQFEPHDLKLALLEASHGKIGNVIDKFFSFCYHYDPQSRRYALRFVKGF